jgi:hypothetical protein
MSVADCASNEPARPVGGSDCSAGDPLGVFDVAEGDSPEFGVVEYGRAAGEAAADDDALAVPSAGFEAAVRTLEVVELTGRVTVPAGADPAEARAPAPGCAAAAVDPPTSLAARSAAAPAASPSREPESETPLSRPVAVREAAPVGEAEDALAEDAFAAAPPTPGMPNPAGDLGFPAAAEDMSPADGDTEVTGGTDAEAAGGADPEAAACPDPEGARGADAEAAAGPEAEVARGVDAEAARGAEAEAAEDADLRAGTDACGVFTAGATCVDVDAGDVASAEVGADASVAADSVSTGPSGSNN